MLTYQIRGGLGTQLLNLMAAYGDAFEKGKDIEKIVLNFFNYPDGLREVNIDFISKTIEHHLKVETKSGTDKFAIFNKDRIENVKKHIHKIRRSMPIKLNDMKIENVEIDKDLQLNKMIEFERNRQLTRYSTLHYKRIYLSLIHI